MAKIQRKNFGNARLRIAAAARRIGIPKPILRRLRRTGKELFVDSQDLFTDKAEELIRKIPSNITPTMLYRNIDPSSYRAAMDLLNLIKTTDHALLKRGKLFRYLYVSDRGIYFTNNPKKALRLIDEERQEDKIAHSDGTLLLLNPVTKRRFGIK